MSKQIESIIKEADDCYLNNDFTGAAERIREAVNKNPSNAELWATWGNMEFQLGNNDEAIDKYNEACKLAPEKADYHTYLAIAYLKENRIEEFENSLESALNIDPEHIDSLRLLGDLCFQNNKKKEAAKSYFKVLKKNPDNADVLMRLGSCLYEFGELDVAKNCYERVLNLDSSNDMALDNLATCNAKLTDSVKNHDETSSLNENIHDILDDAEFFSNSGNADSTAETLEQAVNLAPNEAIFTSALGSVYFKLGKYEKARDMFRSEIELSPRNADAYTRLSMAALLCERIEEFESSIGIALEINPAHIEALRFLGKINLQTSRYLDAARIFAKLIEIKSDFPEFYLALGYALHEGGETATAKSVFERVLMFDANNECAIKNLHYISNPDKNGSVLSHTIPNGEEIIECQGLADGLIEFEFAFNSKDSGSVKTILNRIFEVTPENYEVITALSTLFFQVGEYNSAMELVNKAIQLDQAAPEAWTQLALLELNNHNYKSAITAIDKSLERHPCSQASKLKGKILYLAEDHKDALSEFEQLLKCDPDNVYLLQCTAICWHKLGRNDEAKITYERILKLDTTNKIAASNLNAIDIIMNQKARDQSVNPRDFDPILIKSDEYYQKGDFDKAIDTLEEGATKSCENSDLFATLGSLLFQKGLYEEAANHLGKAVLLRGDSPDFLTRLALAEYKTGDINSFLEHIENALSHDPNYVGALKLRADNNLNSADHQTAAKDYKKIVKLEPENTEVLLALAICYYNTGNLDACILTYERVLTIDPENALAKQNLSSAELSESTD